MGMYHQRRSQHEVTFVFRHNEAPFWQTKQCWGRHATNPQDCAAWRRLPEKSPRCIRQNVPAVVTMSQLYPAIYWMRCRNVRIRPKVTGDISDGVFRKSPYKK